MNEPVKLLKEVFNLSDYEARLYVAAQGELATVSDLSARSGIPRTAIYPSLKSLIEKGFIMPLKARGKRTLYRAIDPKYLKQIYSHKLVDLDEIIEHLGKSISATSEDVAIRYFEGRDGVYTAGDIFLLESKSKLWKTFENPVYVERLIGTHQFDDYVRRRVNKGISGRIIIPAYEYTPWIKEVLAKRKEWLLEVQIVSPQIYPLETTLAIAGDWIFAESAKQRPFALLVKNAPLARTLESIHDMVWDRFRVS